MVPSRPRPGSATPTTASDDEWRAEGEYIAAALSATALFVPDDATVLLVAGSHRTGRAPSAGEDGAVTVRPPAGSCLIADGRLWMSAPAVGPGDAAVLNAFCGPQIRPEENNAHAAAGAPAFRASLPDAAKEQLGLRVWHSYGAAGPKRLRTWGRLMTIAASGWA